MDDSVLERLARFRRSVDSAQFTDAVPLSFCPFRERMNVCGRAEVDAGGVDGRKLSSSVQPLSVGS